MKLIIKVYLKDDIYDPEGEDVRLTLEQLGFSPVSRVRVGKVFDIEIASEDSKDAVEGRRLGEGMVQKLLAHPTIERGEVSVEE